MTELLHASIRSLAVAAFAALCLRRVRSAALKHAVWTLITAGMLLQLLSSSLLGPLNLPVLKPVPVEAMAASLATSAPIAAFAPAPRRLPLLPAFYLLGAAFFAARLLRAVLFTRRLIRRSQPLAPGRRQSGDIAVPMTAGGQILLPLDWPAWDEEKLRAVLAHEEAHIRRRDSGVALLARINRCVFWFHPLAWWLEHHLAQLAEQACDDAALSILPDRQAYARTLLDMARAVHASHGRFLTSAMAKAALMERKVNVETRIDRILDETRRIPRAPGRIAWTALAACAAPLIYLAAAVQFVPTLALAQIPAPAPPQPPAQIAPAAAPQAVTAPPVQPALPAGTLGVDGPVFIPKIYNGRNKTFFFFAPQTPQPAPAAAPVVADPPRPDFADLPKPAGPAFPQPAGQPDPSSVRPQIPSVAFSELRSGVITVPLDGPGEHEINVRITDASTRRFIMSADSDVTGDSYQRNISLKPGEYILTILTKSEGGKTTRSDVRFEVQ